MSVIELLAAVLLLLGSVLILRAVIAADLADAAVASVSGVEAKADDLGRAA